MTIAVDRKVAVEDAAVVGTRRFDRLDALRGVAIVWMAGFHFSFDLNHFRFIHPGLLARSGLDGAAGLHRHAVPAVRGRRAGGRQRPGQPAARFWKRWAQVAGCALLVTLGSWWMFPASYISFGVLHGIAVMLIVVRFTTAWGRLRWPLGLVALALPWVVQDPYFDTRATDWMGLVTRLPYTEDFVPVLPWLGVMWWGAAGTDWLLAQRRDLLAGPIVRGAAPLAALGRWSLTFYMVHQPVLLGLVAAAAWLLHGSA